jgi:prephenate dehydrogenase/prephenate dehydratase
MNNLGENKKIIGIIGYGRFGKVLANILEDNFNVKIYDIDNSTYKQNNNHLNFSSLDNVLNCNTIFYCVPISKFESVLKSHLPFFKNCKDSKLLIDVLSVKVHPKKIFQKLLPKHFEALLTHPMFGPDSIRMKGLPNQPIILDQFRANNNKYKFWKDFFESKKLKIIELSAEEHDNLAANSQGLAFFVGRTLGDFGIKPTPIDTLGAKKLHEVMEQTCNDTWELFVDLQNKNPYTKNMRIKLGKSVDKIYNSLLPNRINKEKLVIGIQGGKGSFNEEAARHYLNQQRIKNYELVYLYTSDNVLKALHEGDIDRGQFAMHNSLGGIVKESVEAMSKFKFNIIEEFSIIISHSLMMRKDAKFSEIDTIMTHPQVLKQCKNTLSKKYQNLKLISGEDNLIDHANVAKYLSKNKLPKNIATIGSKVLYNIYDLKKIEDNLQDSKKNFTSFLWVQRPIVDLEKIQKLR